MVLPCMVVGFSELASFPILCITSVLRAFNSRLNLLYWTSVSVCPVEVIVHPSPQLLHHLHTARLALPSAVFFQLPSVYSVGDRNAPPSHLYLSRTPPELSLVSALRMERRVTATRNTLNRSSASTQPCFTPIVTSKVSKWFPQTRTSAGLPVCMALNRPRNTGG